MSFVVVERKFPEPPACFSEIEERELAVRHRLTRRNVVALVSYFSRDRCQMVCVYDSPDAESVREVQRESGLPYEHLWSAQPWGEALLTDPSPKSAVIAVRAFEAGTQEKDFANVFDEAKGCLALYNVEHALSLTSRDFRRSVCLYAAPDAEAVRIINDRYQIPCEALFKGTVHSAS